MHFCLVQTSGQAHQVRYELRDGINTVGRGFDNTIVIEDEARSLSRHHAQIIVNHPTVIVRDLNSSNGTYVNNQRITEQTLKVGDTVRFGRVSFTLEASTSTVGSEARETADDISILLQVRPEHSRNSIQQLLETSVQPQSSNASVLLLPEEQDANQRLATKLKVLMEISNQLASPHEFESLPQKILDLLFQVMRVDRGVLLLANPKTGQLEQKAIKVRQGIILNQEFYSHKIANYVHLQGVGILTDNAVADQRFDQAYSIIQQAICAAMCVPLKAGDRSLGVLYVDNLSQVNIYQKEDLEFLTSLANQAAIAIENANLYQQMQKEAAKRARLERFFPQAVIRKIEEIGDLGIVETEVTALFSDISGFTEMAAKMQPRQVITMLNQYFKVMVEGIVFKFEGTLEKYIADALLAVWGSPYSRGDDVERAIKAAIAMQWAMVKLNQRWAEERTFPQIQIHIGLNTGLVAAGNIGSEQLIQYTNIGDTMNVASRICSVARAGEILISDATLSKVRGQLTIPVEALAPVMVKGKDQPLQLYRVLWHRVQPEGNA
ncbi:MAG: adenylate/guanylate cyclase domain-containing protein [Pseudanabaenaceae cyanobacterium]